MECTAVPPLTDEQVMAASDGLADQAILEHIPQCAYCTARLAAVHATDRSLQQRLRFWDCPPSQELGDYHLGLVNQATERQIIRHIATCARCTTELEEMRVFLQEDRIVQPQPIAQPVRSPRPRLGELIARVMPRTPAVALRGSGSGPLMAEADGTTLILDIQPGANETLTVMGQIVADDQESWTGALVELRAAGRVQALAAVDDLGSFSWTNVPRGSAEVRVTARAGRTILLPDLDLNA